MGNSNYYDVKINVNQKGIQHVRFEKGCSFENNGAIYRLNNDGKLAIFDKAKREWRAAAEITMNSYQFNLFRAVANNTKERENGRELNGFTLSHADIQKALKLAEEGNLTKDLSEYLDDDYKATEVKRYSNRDAVSAYVTNGNRTTSANLVIKFGSAQEAVDLSNILRGNTPKSTGSSANKAAQPKPQQAKPQSKPQQAQPQPKAQQAKPQPKPQQPKQQPKVQQPKQQPKVQQAKPQPKPQQPKQQPKVQQPKQQPKAQQAKPQPKPQQPKQQPKVQQPKAQQPKPQPKPQQPKAQQPKAQQSKPQQAKPQPKAQQPKPQKPGIPYLYDYTEKSPQIKLPFSFDIFKSKPAEMPPYMIPQPEAESPTKDINVAVNELKTKYLPYIEDISKRTGFSKSLIAQILYNEKFTQKATYKNENGGLWEVGFGHTTQAMSNTNFGKGFKISLQKAFAWFEQDLKDAKNALRKIPELNFDSLPKSIQEGLIDVVFNRGIGKINPKNKKHYDTNYNKFYAAIKEKDYATAAVRLRQEPYLMRRKFVRGLMKRNVYRFLVAIKDLTPKEQLAAMELFDSPSEGSYYSKTLNNLNRGERKRVSAAWEAYQKALEQYGDD